MLDSNVPQPWRARTTLVLTLSLLAIGLGNLQRMPYLIGEHGGGVFFLSYVLALLLLSVPVLIGEVVIGSLGRGSPGLAMHWAASAANADTRWRYLTFFHTAMTILLSAVAIMTAVWCAYWAAVIYSGELGSASVRDVSTGLVSMLGNGPAQFVRALLATGLAVLISAIGVRAGMGLLAWFVLPCVAVALLGVLDFVFVYTDLRPVADFLFTVEPNLWRSHTIWEALTSAGITLGAGLGVGIALGTQAPQSLPWARSILAAAVLDSAFMVVVAVIVCAMLFEVNVAPVEGLAALFVATPYAFANLPLGEAYGALFFMAMAVTAWSTAVILMEPSVQLIGQDLGLGRMSGAVLAGTAIALIIALMLFTTETALVSVVSFLVEGMLPLSFLATSLFIGWWMPRPVLRGELYREPLWLFRLWWFAIRWLVPPISAAWSLQLWL